MDDYPNDETTTGRFAVGDPISGILDSVALGEPDSDWFRISLSAGMTYNFLATIPDFNASFSVDMENLNNDGFIDRRRPRSFFDDETGESAVSHSILFTASNSADYFFSVNDLSEGQYPNYTISASLYEVPDIYNTAIVLSENVARTHVIDEVNDRDSFRVELSRNGTYDFRMRGVDSGSGTLADPILRLYSGFDGLLATQDGGGTGRDAVLRFVAPFTGTFQISAGAVGGETGTFEIDYSLVTDIDDAATGTGTNSRLTMERFQSRSLEGRLEVDGDIDWHKVAMVANRWYKFSYTSEDADSVMFMRGPDGEILEHTNGEAGEFHVRAAQTGDHHLVFRNGATGYTITSVDDAPPEIAAKHSHFRLLGDQQINFSSLFSLEDYPATRVQVVAESDFYLDGTRFERYEAHNLQLDEIERAVFKGETVRGEFDVSLRAVGGGTTSGWASTVIRSQEDKTPLLETGAKWDSTNTQRKSDNVITYRFADSIPSYFAEGRFTGFAEANSAVRLTASYIFENADSNSWGSNISEIVDLQFVEDDSEDADIQIFTADLDQYAVGYKPGPYGFGDIVLDNDIYSPEANSTPFLDLKADYEFRRAILTALGAKHFVPELNRNESMVGTTFGLDPNVYPQSFGYWDVEFLKATYGQGSGPNFPERTQLLGLSSDSYVRTINAQHPQNPGISTQHASIIDLRPGQTSRIVDDPDFDPAQSYVIGEGVYVYSARGSGKDDVIYGHHSNNFLHGGGGDDTLHGLGGDDIMSGGLGDDTYVYETGDGNDVIDESGGFERDQGNDALLVRGKFGFDSLADLTIQRLGNDLVVNLAMNGKYNRNQGSITIKNMGTESGRIERLELRNFTTNIGTISLPSIFNAATVDQQPFLVTESFDDFGAIAVPVS